MNPSSFHKLSKEIFNLTTKTDSIFINIELVYINYKQKFKDLEVIIYILKNVYTNDKLQKLCYNYSNNIRNETTSSNKSNNDTETNKKTTDNKKSSDSKKDSKYIAIYSN